MKNSDDNAGMFKTGDLVIGSSDPNKSVYSATGAKLLEDGVHVYGRENDLSNIIQELSRSAIRSGGVPLGTQNKKKVGKKSQQLSAKTKSTHASFFQEPEPEPVQQKPQQREETVQFENDFGRIKAKALHVIEHEQAYMLIFKDEDSMVFEPKTGEQLLLHTKEHRYASVYYPGVTFNSPDDSRKFMILFKVPEENQE
jgi:hypothetical protein